MAAGDFTEFFNELLFGTGAWLGALIIVAIIAFITVKNRWSAAVFMPICIFLGIQYLNTVSADLTWIGILMFVMAVYCLATLIAEARKS